MALENFLNISERLHPFRNLFPVSGLVNYALQSHLSCFEGEWNATPPPSVDWISIINTLFNHDRWRGFFLIRSIFYLTSHLFYFLLFPVKWWRKLLLKVSTRSGIFYFLGLSIWLISARLLFRRLLCLRSGLLVTRTSFPFFLFFVIVNWLNAK